MSIFSNVKMQRPRKSAFNLSHERKMSFDMGRLVPIMVEEIVPGDSFKVSSEIFIRFAPMLAPIMHRVNVFTHYFFVPNRIIWNGWETFITGGQDGLQTAPFPIMEINETHKTYFGRNRVGDYLGLPIVQDATTVLQPAQCSALPFRAYQEIYNEYYREPNLEQIVDYSKGDGPIDILDYNKLTDLRWRSWEKDYFTSALPWPQRGLDVTAPMTHTPNVADTVYDTVTKQPRDNNPNLETGSGGSLLGNDGAASQFVSIDNTENLGITINDLRTSARLQEWLEKNARGGYRYIEQILSHFGVKSSDARLQRPEYLGGGKQPVTVSEVLNTTGATADPATAEWTSPQGNMAGHAVSVGSGNRFKRSFEEHGYIIGIMSVLPRTAYQQGITREFRKFDKFDYYWPEFAHLGEQEVVNGEIFHNYNDAATTPDKVFGYQQRYAEYKFRQSSVHGEFREPLDFWHMGRQFTTEPALNTTFTRSSDVTDRIFAVTDDDPHQLYAQIYNRVKAIRPMPYYNQPKL